MAAQPDKSARAYNLRATDKTSANRCRTLRNGKSSFDMSAILCLNKGHLAASASKSREILFDNLMSDKAEAMLLRLQVRLMSECVSGGQCST